MRKFLKKIQRRPQVQEIPAHMGGSASEAFTLIEVLIAASIFTIVSLIAVTVFVNVMRIQRRVALENAIYEDARVMMERIAREVRENTVDYEEYYNKTLAQAVSLPGLNNLQNPYGTQTHNANPYGYYYGCYAQRFYNTGKNNLGANKPGDFTAYCNDGNPASQEPACIINKNTLDINTGQNPYAGIQSQYNHQPDANAFCDLNFSSNDPSCGQPLDSNHNIQNELYLINPQGTEKTILARKQIDNPAPKPAEYALSLLRLDGQDQDHDGVVETWRNCDPNTYPDNKFCCASGFDCSDDSTFSYGNDSLEYTLLYNSNMSLYKGFVPISPTRTDVISLKFLIAPLEDPRKAFAETDDVTQQQPHVTILMTVQPSQSELSGYDGDIPTVTLQTTVASRVYNEIKSYYPGPVPGTFNGVCGTTY